MQRLALFLLLVWSYSGFSAEPKKSLRIAAYDLNPYVSKDRSEHGYMYDLVTGIFREAGYKVHIEFFPPLRAKSLVMKGSLDVLMPSYAVPQDGCCLRFSQPIHGSQIGYLRRAGENDSMSAQDFSQLIVHEKEGILTSSSDKIVRILDMLVNHRLNIAIADKFQVSDALVNMRPHLIDKVKFVMPALGSKNLHIAVSKKIPNSARIIEDFNRGLEAWQARGDYDRLLLRYGYPMEASENKTLNIAIVNNPDMLVLKELSREFSKKHPDIQLRWFTMDENILRRNVLSGLALGDRFFDVIAVGNYDSRIYATKGWIEPLNPPASYALDDILPAVRDSLSHAGRIHALPFYAEGALTYYRRDLFQSKGLTMPEQPTFDDLRTLAAKIHDPKQGIHGICLRGKPGWGENVALISPIVDAFNGQWVNQQGQLQLTSAAWQKGIQFYINLVKTYGPADAHKNGFKENLQLFAEGRCGIWVDASVAGSYLLNPQHSRVASQLGFVSSPKPKDRSGLQWFWVWALALPSSSTQKGPAQTFIAWATSRDYAKLVADHHGWLSAPPGTRRSLYENPAYRKAVPFALAVKKEMESGYSNGLYQNFNRKEAIRLSALPEFTAIGNIVGIQISLALQGKMSVEAALREAQDTAAPILARADSKLPY